MMPPAASVPGPTPRMAQMLWQDADEDLAANDDQADDQPDEDLTDEEDSTRGDSQ